MAVEVLTKESCKTGTIVERIIKTMCFIRVDSESVEEIVINKKFRCEVLQHGGQIVHTKECLGTELFMSGIPLRFTDDEFDNGFVIVKKG